MLIKKIEMGFRTKLNMKNQTKHAHQMIVLGHVWMRYIGIRTKLNVLIKWLFFVVYACTTSLDANYNTLVHLDYNGKFI